MLSPVIEPRKYSRPDEESSEPVTVQEYTYDKILTGKVRGLDKFSIISGGLVVCHTDFGEVYLGDGHAHVGHGIYKSNKMVFLRELVLDCIIELDDANAVEGLRVVDTREVDTGARGSE